MVSLFQYDPDDDHYDDLINAEAPDEYESIEIQRSRLNRQLNLLEDEEENNDVEIDVVNDDGVPVYLPGRDMNRPDPYIALSEAAMRENRNRQRMNIIRRNMHRLNRQQQQEMREIELRMEIRDMDRTARESEADAALQVAMGRLQAYADRQALEENEREAGNSAQNEEADRSNEGSNAGEPLCQVAADQEQGESAAPLNEATNAAGSVPEPCQAEYLTPANTEAPAELDLLMPEAPIETEHLTDQTYWNETEFLTPVTNRRAENTENDDVDHIHDYDEMSPAQYASASASAYAYASPNDQVVDNNHDGDIFLPEYQPAIESGVNSGYLTPVSRRCGNLGISMPESMQHAGSLDEATGFTPVRDFYGAVALEYDDITMSLPTRHEFNTNEQLSNFRPCHDQMRRNESNEHAETHPPATEVSQDSRYSCPFTVSIRG